MHAYLFYDNNLITYQMGKYRVSIEICSNCKEHAWCTRHNEATYSAIAEELAKELRGRREDIDVNISKVGGTKMGSFEVKCINTTLFSKLALGYFPHTVFLGNRVQQFIEDTENGKDTSQYHNLSPVKYHPNTKPYSTNSPYKGSTNSNSAISNYGSNVQFQDTKKQIPSQVELKPQENSNKAKEEHKKQVIVAKSTEKKVKAEEQKIIVKEEVHKVEGKKQKAQEHPKQHQQHKQPQKHKEVVKKQEHLQKHVQSHPIKVEKHEEKQVKHQQKKEAAPQQHHQQEKTKVPSHKQATHEVRQGQKKHRVEEKIQEKPKQQKKTQEKATHEQKKELTAQKQQTPSKAIAKQQVAPIQTHNPHPQAQKTPQKQESPPVHKQQAHPAHTQQPTKEEKHEVKQHKQSPQKPHQQNSIEAVVQPHVEKVDIFSHVQP